MKKQLIHEDNKLLTQILSDLKTYTPLLGKMKTSYEVLELGTFNSEVMSEIINHGLKNIEIDFYENIGSQLDNTGITSKAIRESLINSSKAQFTAFKESYSQAFNYTPPQYGLNTRPTLEFNNISFCNDTNTFIVNDQMRNEIKENHCRIYLETKEEIALYNALENFVNAQAGVKEILAAANFSFSRQGYEIQEIANVFLTSNDGIEVNPKAIKPALTQFRSREFVKNILKRTAVSQ